MFGREPDLKMFIKNLPATP